MKGSEKQVVWAEDIQSQLSEKWEVLKKEMRTEVPQAVANYMSDALSRDDAKYYIETWKFVSQKGFSLQKVLENEDGEVGDAAFDWMN